jgi:hypothetical protein
MDEGARGRSLLLPRRRVLTWIGAVAVGVVGLSTLVLVLRGDDALRLDDVREGVTFRELAGEQVFFVREDDDVRVFLADARHLPDDTLWWCPNEQVFVEVEHSSQFDRQGRKIAGPARGGLNRYAVRVVDGELVIDDDEIILGRLTPHGELPKTFGRPDFGRPYDSGEGSFCDGALGSPAPDSRSVPADPH